jgi:hypothetical protein
VQRFQISLQYQHVKAHSGKPGNELVDALAHQAALGEPMHDLDGWLGLITNRSFVQRAECLWFLFRPDIPFGGKVIISFPLQPLTPRHLCFLHPSSQIIGMTALMQLVNWIWRLPHAMSSPCCQKPTKSSSYKDQPLALLGRNVS